MAEKLIIAGSHINLDADEFKKIKNKKQLQKLEIFSHLSDERKEAAETELLGKLGITDSTGDQSTTDVVK